MADPFPQNVPGDEAALMADENSVHPATLDHIDTSSDDDDDESEDPTGGKGSKKKNPASVFSYRSRKEPPPKFRVRGGSFPTTKFRQTPGARRIP